MNDDVHPLLAKARHDLDVARHANRILEDRLATALDTLRARTEALDRVTRTCDERGAREDRARELVAEWRASPDRTWVSALADDLEDALDGRDTY